MIMNQQNAALLRALREKYATSGIHFRYTLQVFRCSGLVSEDTFHQTY